MLVRPEASSQTHRSADVWRVNATEVKSQVYSSALPRNASVSSRTSRNRQQWRKRGIQRWFHASLSIAGVLVLNGTFHSSKVELVMCASFLVILKFLFDDPLSNFFHIHTGNGSTWSKMKMNDRDRMRHTRERKRGGTQVNLESVCICGWERRRKKPPARLRKINNMRNMRMHATWETCLFKKYGHRHGNIVIIGSYIHRTSIHALILLG